MMPRDLCTEKNWITKWASSSGLYVVRGDIKVGIFISPLYRKRRTRDDCRFISTSISNVYSLSSRFFVSDFSF